MTNLSSQPIIVIRRKRRSHQAPHHAGAWKVAYADFVTAMMAFFLLLWLLNVTTADQRRGIADYFSPASVSRVQSGSGGVVGGISVTVPGAQVTATQPIVIEEVPSQGRPGFATSAVEDSEEPAAPLQGPPGDAQGSGQSKIGESDGQSGSDSGDGSPLTDEGDGRVRFLAAGAQGSGQAGSAGAQASGRTGTTNESGTGPAVSEAAQEALTAVQREQEKFQAIQDQLRQTIQSSPELQQLSQNLIIDQTPDGLRVQIVDREGSSMFASGAIALLPQARQLIALVAQAVKTLPNRLSISGHTDSAPFPPNRRNYDNFDLSSERANASRRDLESAGIAASRIAAVVGRADRDPLLPEDPGAPRNRRISIVILSEREQSQAVKSPATTTFPSPPTATTQATPGTAATQGTAAVPTTPPAAATATPPATTPPPAAPLPPAAAPTPGVPPPQAQSTAPATQTN